ncbi:MAG: polyketide cyclase / dehydrase and lipid transport [Pseudonocardiaceae bacterium]|nr:polyketide cyclase / dehydrase and lipid transport [Pseudonocardiaceae bacterium]
MVSVDVVDETYLAVSPRIMAAVFADRNAWCGLWPDLRLEVFADRGDEGLRWTVTGALVGSMEVWLEPVAGGGTMLHYFLRADPADRTGTPRPAGRRRGEREAARRQRAAKRMALTLKRHLEGGRPPGEPPPAGS